MSEATATNNAPRTPAQMDSHIESLYEKAHELSARWQTMLKDSTDLYKDNVRSAKAFDDFFVASYWRDSNPEQTITYLEAGVAYLERVIREGVTTTPAAS